LKSASFNLAVLLGVRVSADIGKLTTILGLSGKLLLLLGRSYLLLFFPLEAKLLLSLLFHLLLELFNLELLILEHSIGEIAESAVHFLIYAREVLKNALLTVIKVLPQVHTGHDSTLETA
jgi:hypothetical protein